MSIIRCKHCEKQVDTDIDAEHEENCGKSVVKNRCTKHNPECVKHTPEWHGPGCVKSGKNKCEDALHIKTCWTSEDLEMMCNILDKHTGDNQAT